MNAQVGTAKYLVVRTALFVVLTTASTAIMSLPYLG